MKGRQPQRRGGGTKNNPGSRKADEEVELFTKPRVIDIPESEKTLKEMFPTVERDVVRNLD